VRRHTPFGGGRPWNCRTEWITTRCLQAMSDTFIVCNEVSSPFGDPLNGNPRFWPSTFVAVTRPGNRYGLFVRYENIVPTCSVRVGKVPADQKDRARRNLTTKHGVLTRQTMIGQKNALRMSKDVMPKGGKRFGEPCGILDPPPLLTGRGDVTPNGTGPPAL